MENEKKIPTLAEWLEGWEAAVASGQSRISREEAERRYHKQYPSEEQREPYR